MPGDSRNVQGPFATIDKRYFTIIWDTLDSQRLNHYLAYALKYPSDVNNQFVGEFRQLANDFENHIRQAVFPSNEES